MFTITRNLARQLRTVFRLALRIGPKSQALPIVLTSGSRGLSIRCQNEHAAIEYFQSGRGAKHELVVPFELLGDVAGTSDASVTIRLENEQVIAEFTQRGQPARHDYPAWNHDESSTFPATPRKRVQHDAQLLTALASAAQTTDDDNYRYALRNVCLQSDVGRVLATDGRQLLAHSGFEFPWKGDLLVPASKVFDCKAWQEIEAAEIGATKTHCFLVAGSWRLWLPIDKEGRYPRVDDVIPEPERITTTITITDEDAEFLLAEANQLPVDDPTNQSVTIEAADQIVVRAAADRKSQPVELLLSNSTCSGKKLRISTDRRYLLRALEQGFRQLQLTADEQPILCRDEQRLYLWAALSGGDAIAAREDATRISSPAPATTTTTSKPSPSTYGRPSLAKNTSTPSSGQANGQPNGNTSTPANNGVDALIEQAEAVRSSLRDAAKDVGELITAMKAHRKQTKLVRSTLASLRQLQAIDA